MKVYIEFWTMSDCTFSRYYDVKDWQEAEELAKKLMDQNCGIERSLRLIKCA